MDTWSRGLAVAVALAAASSALVLGVRTALARREILQTRARLDMRPGSQPFDATMVRDLPVLSEAELLERDAANLPPATE